MFLYFIIFFLYTPSTELTVLTKSTKATAHFTIDLSGKIPGTFSCCHLLIRKLSFFLHLVSTSNLSFEADVLGRCFEPSKWSSEAALRTFQYFIHTC